MPAGTLTPIAGNPVAVDEAARALESVAAHVAATSSKLRALARTTWTGSAATQASMRTATLPPKLDKVVASYSSAGAALRGYAVALADAQSRSVAALRAAASAQADVAQLHAARATAPPEALPRYDASIADAEAALARAEASNEAAREDRCRAIGVAERRLHDASSRGIRNQPWWRHILSSAARFAVSAWTTSLRLAASVATSISALAGLAALAVSIAGLVFPPLEGAAAVLESISLVSGIMAAGADAALAASGNGSWKSVGIDAIALAPWAGSKLVSKSARLLRAPKTTIYASSHVVEPAKVIAPVTSLATWGDVRTLARHFRDHGPDFGVTSPTDYAARASQFLHDAIRDGELVKVDVDGIIRVYDRTANTFGSYNPDGSTRTFFKPTSATYWERQPGAKPWSE
ncbi:MAG TPA: hypothetical protein VFU90_12435 [Candidatus Tumulicola sp.]|nr:hypothetical protein [Candidatus Tumulicola sp.]